MGGCATGDMGAVQSAWSQPQSHARRRVRRRSWWLQRCQVRPRDHHTGTKFLGALYIGIADPHRPERMGTELSLLHCDGPGQHLSRPTPGACRADTSAPNQCACTRSTEGMPSASRHVTCYAWMRAGPLQQHEAHVKRDMSPAKFIRGSMHKIDRRHASQPLQHRPSLTCNRHTSARSFVYSISASPTACLKSGHGAVADIL